MRFRLSPSPHGWTAVTLKVRFYEALDRLVLRCMDAVVCVSEAQGEGARGPGAREQDRYHSQRRPADAFAEPDPSYGDRLRQFFATPPSRIVGAAGRLSPEKGFDQLVEAAGLVSARIANVGFVHFGDGPMRQMLTRQIELKGLRERFQLVGFRTDIAQFLPHLDLMVLPSHTEGLPVVLLEAFAAGVPAVATAVGGIPEVLEEGKSGYLVPPGDPPALARRILDVLRQDATVWPWVRAANGACATTSLSQLRAQSSTIVREVGLKTIW